MLSLLLQARVSRYSIDVAGFYRSLQSLLLLGLGENEISTEMMNRITVALAKNQV